MDVLASFLLDLADATASIKLPYALYWSNTLGRFFLGLFEGFTCLCNCIVELLRASTSAAFLI